MKEHLLDSLRRGKLTQEDIKMMDVFNGFVDELVQITRDGDTAKLVDSWSPRLQQSGLNRDEVMRAAWEKMTDESGDTLQR